MTKFFTTLILLIFSVSIFAQPGFNVELVANVPLAVGENGNDVWGYVDSTGHEYAILGTTRTTRIYSLEDPSNPVEVAAIPGAQSVWRDMKTFGNYIYVTMDQGSDGLLIIDMSDPASGVPFTNWKPELAVDEDVEVLRTCHNIYIDENGVAYLAGCNVGRDDSGASGRGGVIFVDIATDPMNPSMIGYEDVFYAHDVFVQNNIMYTSEINRGEFGIYDVSDKSDPIYLGGLPTSSEFTHNTWASTDGKYLYTTDERPNAFLDAYDISDVNNIRKLDVFQPFEAGNSRVIPHNTHFQDDYLITSWYTEGVVITDVSNPDLMVKVGSYDTFEGEDQLPPGGNWFFGCWGAYPFLPSGLILASDISSGLYVLQPTYKRASYLRGVVTDLSNGNFVNAVEVKLDVAQSGIFSSNPAGEYGAGVVDEGTIDVTFSHPDYKSQTISVDIASGTTAMLDVALEPLVSFTIDGVTIRTGDNALIPNSKVKFVNADRTVEITTDAIGEFSESIVAGEYDIFVGAWGFFHKYIENYSLDNNAILTLELDPGYQDDFLFDLGWTEDGDASRGSWERGVPIGTEFSGLPSNPGMDIDGDLGESCYVTGNGGGSGGADDIDGGVTFLTSPEMDLSIYAEPILKYSTWFVNRGGSPGEPEPNDTLNIYINNGLDEVRLETIQEDIPEWRDESIFNLQDYIDITNQMRLIVVAGEYENGHIVEAGFDAFIVSEGLSAVNEQDIDAIQFVTTPNPFDQILEIDISTKFNTTSLLVELNDINGRLFKSLTLENKTNVIISTSDLSPGIYFVSITDGDQHSIRKVIKQ